jgi:hypothetical protein
MTGRPSSDYNDLKIEFGAYALVYEANDLTNTNKAKSTGAITLTQTGNAQGGYFFMSLTTGKRLSRQQWDELPMPDGVIATVEAMAEVQRQPIFDNGTPSFEWSPGIAIDDDNEAPVIVDFDEQGAAQDNDADDEQGAAQDNNADENEEQVDMEEAVSDAEEDGADDGHDNNPPGLAEEVDEDVDDASDSNGFDEQDKEEEEESRSDDSEDDVDVTEAPLAADDEVGDGENIENDRYNLRPNRDRHYRPQ